MDIQEEVKNYLNIEFTINDDMYPFADIITLEESEYNLLSPIDIKTMQIERYQNWLNIIKAGE